MNRIYYSRYTHSLALRGNAGFTLIEVLIAMVILAIGLLGLAGLQATGLENNQSAYYRSQATQLAYNMADRMRANVVEAKKYATSIYITQGPTAAANQPGCTTIANTCTPAQMAQQDLFEWNQGIVTILPLGQGTISVKPPIYTITITWDDNRDKCINPGDPNPACAGEPNDPNFQMSFQL